MLVNTCKAKRQRSCRMRSTHIENTYHLKSSFKWTLYPFWTIWRSAISQHHYRDMHCTKSRRAHQSPSNLFSCPESGLKFAYFAVKFFQLFFTVQRWHSGIVLRKANWIYIVIKEKKKKSNRTTARFLPQATLFVPFRHPMSIVRPIPENVNYLLDNLFWS